MHLAVAVPDSSGPAEPEPLIPQWRSWLVDRGLSPKTIRAYVDTINDAGGERVADFSHLDIGVYLHGKAWSARTRIGRIASFTSFFRFLIRIDVRADNPTDKVDRPKVRKSLPRPILDVPGTLDALEALDHLAALVFIFLTATGLRIHEAEALHLTVPVPDELMILGKGNKERMVPLSQSAQAALNELGGHMPYKARCIQRWFSRVGITPHRCRHTAATRWLKKTGDIAKVGAALGHASAATTAIYAKVDADQLRDMVEDD